MRTEMLYKENNGLPVCEEGPVIIEGVEHYVKGGFVSCDAGMNSRAWNTTKKESRCGKCYREPVQYKLELK